MVTIRLKFLILLFQIILISCGDGVKDKPSPKHELYESKEFSAICDIDTEALKNILDQDVTKEINCLKTNLVQYTKYVRRPGNRDYITQAEITKFILRYFPADDTSMADALELIFNLNTLILKDQPRQLSLSNIVPFFKILLVANSEAAIITKNLRKIVAAPKSYLKLRPNLRASIKRFSDTTIALVVNSDKTYKGKVSITEFLVGLKDQMGIEIDIKAVSSFLFIKKLIVGGEKDSISPDEIKLFISKLEEMVMASFDLILSNENQFSSQKKYFEFMAKRVKQFQESMYQWEDNTEILQTEHIISLFKILVGDKHDIDKLAKKLELLKYKLFGGKPNSLTFLDIKITMAYIYESFTALSLYEPTTKPYAEYNIEIDEKDADDDDLDFSSFIELIISKSDKVFEESLDLIGELKAILIGGPADKFHPVDGRVLIPLLMSLREHSIASTIIIKQIKKGNGDFWQNRDNLAFHLQGVSDSYKKYLSRPNPISTDVDISEFLLNLKKFLKEFDFGIKLEPLTPEIIPSVKALKLTLCGGSKDKLTTNDLKEFMKNFSSLSLTLFDIMMTKKIYFESKNDFFDFMENRISSLSRSVYNWDDDKEILKFNDLITLLTQVVGDKYDISKLSSKLLLLKDKFIGGSDNSFSFLDLKIGLKYTKEVLNALSKLQDQSLQPSREEGQDKTSDIDRFIKLIISKDNEVIDSALTLIWDIKQLLVKGTNTRFVPDDANKLVPLLISFKDHGVAALNIINDIKADRGDVWKKREQFTGHIKSIVSTYNEVLRSYPDQIDVKIEFDQFLERLRLFLTEFDLGVRGDKFHSEIFPIIKSIKLLTFGGSKDELTSSDIGHFFNQLPSLTLSLLDLMVLREKHYKNIHLRNESIYIAINTISMQFTKYDKNREIITFDELENSLKKLFPKYKELSIGALAKNLFFILTQTKKEQITQADINTLFELSLEGIGINYFNLLTYKLTEEKSTLPIQMPPIENYHTLLRDKLSHFFTRYINGLKTGRYYLTKHEGQYYNYNYHITNFGLNVKIIARWALEQIYKTYGEQNNNAYQTLIPYRIRAEKLQEVFEVFTPLLDMLGFKLSETMASTTTYLGDLFQFGSNGNSYLDIFEARDYLELVYNGYNLGNKLTELLPDECKSKDSNGSMLYDSICFKESFFDNFLNVLEQSKMISGLATYINSITVEERIKYLETVELFSKSNVDPNVPYTSLDVIMLIGGILNIESAFIRFDQNQDAILDKEEAEVAFITYKQLILQISDLDEDSKLVKSLFFYLLEKKKKPSAAKLLWYHQFSNKKINASRLSIAKIIEFVMAKNSKDDNDDSDDD